MPKNAPPAILKSSLFAETPKTFPPPICKSSKFPVKPLGALTPKPVPAVLQFVELVPVGSISTCGFVVVLVPPENHEPVTEERGVDAAPEPVIIIELN
jgi:hypothetical protein